MPKKNVYVWIHFVDKLPLQVDSFSVPFSRDVGKHQGLISA